jgi:hypothetical protein
LFLKGLKRHALLLVALALWLPAVAYGIGVVWQYSTTPSHPASPPAQWPTDVPIQREKSRATLVMFAHPRCGCSKASLGELAIIMAHAREKLDAYVFFYTPRSEASTWAHTDLWDDAKAIPGVRAAEDRENTVAQGFGAFTSGQTVVYDSGGRLIFKGGITASRGHSGDSYGRDAIIALVQGQTLRQTGMPVSAPVFGCSWRNNNSHENGIWSRP